MIVGCLYPLLRASSQNQDGNGTTQRPFQDDLKGNIKIRNVQDKIDELKQYSKISKAGGGGSNLNLGVHIINSKIEIDIFLSFYTFHLQKNLFV